MSDAKRIEQSVKRKAVGERNTEHGKTDRPRPHYSTRIDTVEMDFHG